MKSVKPITTLVRLTFIALLLQGCASTLKPSPETFNGQKKVYTASKAESFVADDKKNKVGQQLIELYSPEAKKGNPIALYHIGNVYASGLGGIKKNPVLGMMYLELSAERGYAKAQHNLAAGYKLGTGLPQSYKDAAIWYEKAASQGHVSAQVQLGMLYLEHLKAESNSYKSALKWLHTAAMQGSADGQVVLASMYLKGERVPQNHMEAYVWLSIAAASGDKDARKARDHMESSLSPESLSAAQNRSIDLFNEIMGQQTKSNTIIPDS